MDDADPALGKVLSLDELLARRDAARRNGHLVVQCHGCFDLVHPGHVRHLKHAAKQGDILLVTVTADELVGKGEGRPLIPQDLRAENLAALDCVDWVLINPRSTATELLAAVQPDVYVKGREYESNDDPRFAAERCVVEETGGRVVFSSGDVVFSSTALIRALQQPIIDPAPALHALGTQWGATSSALIDLIDSFQGKRVCVVGECITDTYFHCDAPEIAGESPVMSLRPLERRSDDGGASVIARHLAALGARPIVVTGLPRAPQAQALRDRLALEGIEVRAIDVDGAMLEKQRFLVGTQKVMKVDLVAPITIDVASQGRLLQLADDAAAGCDAAIIADFGSGLLTSGLIPRLARQLRKRVAFLAGDVSGRRGSLMHMEQMDLLTPTEAELRDAVRDYDDSLNAVVWRLLDVTRSRRALITMGADGLTAFERREHAPKSDGWVNRLRGEHVPALAMHPIDTLGCGDAALAVATLALACGPNDDRALRSAAMLAAIAAATKAQKLGNVPIAAHELRLGAARLGAPAPTITTRAPEARMVV